MAKFPGEREPGNYRAGHNVQAQTVLSPASLEAARMSLWAWYWQQDEATRKKIDAERERAP